MLPTKVFSLIGQAYLAALVFFFCSHLLLIYVVFLNLFVSVLFLT